VVDFALIGHQESWRAVARVLGVLRGPQRTPLPDDEIKDILPWIPPRAVCYVDIGSTAGAKAHGLYIDSFIPPDRLEAAYVHENIARVRGAAACAIKAGAKIVSLGGFSSILIEGNFDQLPERRDTVFTTGNTLTVAFIVQGIRKMCALVDRDISRSTVLVVGATGDVGSGCARCLAPLVKRVLLRARNVERLHRLADLRREPCVTFASAGPRHSRRRCLRCRLPEEPLRKRGNARQQNLLRRSGTNHGRNEVRAGF
jgi:fatty aldehyde-generating acyl-ACP reductase